MNTSNTIEELYDMYSDDDASVINHLDPIEELYDMYSEEEEALRIVEVVEDSLDLDLDLKDRLADPYLEL